MGSCSKQDKLAFMTFIVEVDVSTPKWAKAVKNIISSMEGVKTCRIREDGMVEVSGTVDPELLMKKLAKTGRNARVHFLKFGQCSSNLFLPPAERYGVGAAAVGPYGGGGGRVMGFPDHHHYYGDNFGYNRGHFHNVVGAHTSGSTSSYYSCVGYNHNNNNINFNGGNARHILPPPAHGGYHRSGVARRQPECDECEEITITCCSVM